MATLTSLNLAHPHTNPAATSRPTGINKVPTTEPVAITAPGSRRDGAGSGLAGDTIGDRKHHGGDDQAVYAYAREDLDAWQQRLDRELTDGMFGENFTTAGVDVTGARIGERWQVGDDGLVLEVTSPRTPCRTFVEWLGIDGWIKTFTQAAVPGAYLRVVRPGTARAGDRIVVTDRPDHDITVGLVFRAMLLEPDLLPRLTDVDALPARIRDAARQRVG